MQSLYQLIMYIPLPLRSVIAATAAVVLLAAGASSCSKSMSVTDSTPEVEVMQVTDDSVIVYGEYDGLIRAHRFVEINARVDGYLEHMSFVEGSHITKGQVLFTIDPGTYKANVSRARANLDKARVEADKARRDLERIRPLYEKNAASQLDLDNAEVAYSAAKAEVEGCKADLSTAEITLGYTTVRAPISGYISGKVPDIGTYVGPSGKSLLATIEKTDSVRVEFAISAPEYIKGKTRIIKILNNDTTRTWRSYVTLSLSDGTVYPHTGVVDFASPSIDPETGSFAASALVPNPAHNLLPGEKARVKIFLDMGMPTIAVPTTAVKMRNDSAFVTVLDAENVTAERYIDTGIEFGPKVIVRSGLAPGDIVVADNTDDLAPGTAVRPVNASR
ncbi:MAG: efflux RND transporter periplasmic adaptor subunit [Duncaniella sp.]|nr:efflux RND transporter periplasmic adaptor subunit [Duncaniella sp.]